MGKTVWKALVMITQIGISMMVPIFLCLFLGIKLDEWLDANWGVPVFLILGIATSFRNVYHMTKTFYAKDKAREEAEWKYYEEMRRERETLNKTEEGREKGGKKKKHRPDH